MMFAGSPHQQDSCHSSGFYEDCSAGERDAGWKRLYVMPPPQWHHSSTWLSLFLCSPSSWFHSKHRPCLCKRLLSLLLRLWETSKKPVVKMMFSIRDCGWRYVGGVGRASRGQELPLSSMLWYVLCPLSYSPKFITFISDKQLCIWIFQRVEYENVTWTIRTNYLWCHCVRILLNCLIVFLLGALLSVPQWGGKEGAAYVQCPEEEGSTGKGHSKTPAPQQHSGQHLWACTFPVLHVLCTSSNMESTGESGCGMN